MRQLLLFLLLVPTLNTALAQHEHTASPTPKAKQQDRVIYTCVMHPEVQMSKPGNCPKCWMKLVRKVIKSAPSMPAIENKKDNMAEMSMDDSSEHNAMSVANMEDTQYVAQTVNMESGKVVMDESRNTVEMRNGYVHWTEGKGRKAINHLLVVGTVSSMTDDLTKGVLIRCHERDEAYYIMYMTTNRHWDPSQYSWQRFIVINKHQDDIHKEIKILR